MAVYNGNAETIHLRNFVLYSGHVDPAELVRKATEQAQKEGSDKDTSNELAHLLRKELHAWTDEFAPGYNGLCDDDVEDAARWYTVEQYKNIERDFLVAPILISALGRISLTTAARLILEHVVGPVEERRLDYTRLREGPVNTTPS